MQKTGYYDYVSLMPGGERSRANLDMLLQKALVYENTSYDKKVVQTVIDSFLEEIKNFFYNVFLVVSAGAFKVVAVLIALKLAKMLGII